MMPFSSVELATKWSDSPREHPPTIKLHSSQADPADVPAYQSATATVTDPCTRPRVLNQLRSTDSHRLGTALHSFLLATPTANGSEIPLVVRGSTKPVFKHTSQPRVSQIQRTDHISTVSCDVLHNVRQRHSAFVTFVEL